MKLKNFLKAVLLHATFICSTLSYNVDIADVDWNTTNPDTFDINFKVVRPSRSVFGLSGFLDIKQDIDTDDAICTMKIYYSSDGMRFQLSALNVPPQTVTQALNGPYKDYLMDTMLECCTNALEIENFTSPLNKRLIECENCEFPADNFPTALRPGFYRLVSMVNSKQVNAAIAILLKVELNF